MNTLVLGIGNLIMGDEGVGVHVVRRLQQYEIPGVDIVDGGTGGFHLLEYFENYDRVVLIDATIGGEPAGTVKMLRPKFSSDYPTTLTAHDIGLKDLIDSLYLLEKLPEIILFTVSIPGLGSLHLELSEELKPAVAHAVEAVMDYLASA